MKKVTNILFTAVLVISGCNNEKAFDEKTHKSMVSCRNLGLAYLEEENFIEALVQFDKLTKIAPKEPLGFANLGLTYMRSEGELKRAERWLKKALRLKPDDPSIRLLLALFYELNNSELQALDMLENTLKSSPGHVKTLYKLSLYNLKMEDQASQTKAKNYLKTIIEILPANIIARLKYIEILLKNGNDTEGLEQMKKISQIFPKLPENSEPILNNAIGLLENKDAEQAHTYAIIFHNLIRPTPYYQASLLELRGTSGPISGLPLYRFLSSKPHLSDQTAEEPSVVFKRSGIEHDLKIFKKDEDSEDQAGKTSLMISLGDYDLDNDIDIFVSEWSKKKKNSRQYLFSNEDGRFSNKSLGKGIKHDSKDLSSMFSDYNNDGYVDLLIMNSEGHKIYKNSGDNTFDLLIDSGIKGSKNSGGLFFDIDIEGDLDLVLMGDKKNEVFRNNSDGMFSKVNKDIGINDLGAGGKLITHADLNDDGDNDIIIVTLSGECHYYENLRGGYFQRLTKDTGLNSTNDPGSVIVGDYNNDGNIDLFISGLQKNDHLLYQNMGNGSFELDKNWEKFKKSIPKISGRDSKFFDFDNDGYLDLLIAGEVSSEIIDKSGLMLFHNTRIGSYSNVSHLLPQTLGAVDQIEVADHDNDGDIDIFLITANGEIDILRNDGGNLNNYINIRLAGLRTGSGKNNYFGIGSKVEVKSGGLYQARYMDGPVAHFGLGNSDSVDVVRVLWSNGVPQNRIKPEQNQTILETQVLKGSCPYLFLWNGSEYEFSTDVLWPSALGMPLGIMAGEPLYAFANSTDEYIKMPSNILKPKNDKYLLQFTTELWETPYLDKVELLVLDHPGDVNIYIDETFTPPPFKPFKVYSVKSKYLPVLAQDEKGNSVLDKIIDLDKNYLSGFISGDFQGVTRLHDLILNFEDLDTSDSLFLFLQGWLFPTDASINVNLSQSSDVSSIFPYLEVPDKNGNWKTVIKNIGFPKGKNKTMIINMTDKFITDDHRIRIRTNMQIYWDHIFISDELSNKPVKPIHLQPISANLHYRGFSDTYQENLSSPHLPKYYSTTKGQKWRDLLGSYTRYGEVVPLLLDSDSKYVVMNAGDEITLQFDAKGLPSLEEGWTRDFIFYNDGWLKDGDFNTASGKTVGPLPFHGMTSYPAGAENGYPDDEDHSTYRSFYNTRIITTDTFKQVIKEN